MSDRQRSTGEMNLTRVCGTMPPLMTIWERNVGTGVDVHAHRVIIRHYERRSHWHPPCSFRLLEPPLTTQHQNLLTPWPRHLHRLPTLWCKSLLSALRRNGEPTEAVPGALLTRATVPACQFPPTKPHSCCVATFSPPPGNIPLYVSRQYQRR